MSATAITSASSNKKPGSVTANLSAQLEARSSAMTGVSGERWARLKKQGMFDIVNRLLVHLLPGAPGCDDACNIEQCCPGIFICINAFYDSLQKSFGERPRAMRASEFVDIRLENP